MSSFKGLIPKNLLSDDAIVPIKQKVQDYKKVSYTSLDYFNNVAKLFDTQSTQLQKLLQQIKIQEDLPQYYKQLIHCFIIIQKQGTSFSERIQGLFRQMNKMYSTVFSEYYSSIQSFQQSIRNYHFNQQIAQELAKKYFKSLKTITNSMESYKTSFSDVKLIYNNREKSKRYSICQNDYQTVCEDYQNVLKQVDKLNEMKEAVKDSYEELIKQMGRMIKAIGSREISQCKNFTNYYCDLTKTRLTLMAEQKIILQETNLSTLWTRLNKDIYQQYFKVQLNQAQCKEIPCLIYYHKQVKDEFLSFYLKSLGEFAKFVQKQCDIRRAVNKKIFDFLTNFMKLQEKNYLNMMKQTSALFDKSKKKIGEYFGARMVSFIKPVNSLMESTVTLTQKTVKKMSINLTKITQLIADQNNLLDLVDKQVYSHIQKLIGKKQIKKKQNSDIIEFTQEQNSFYSAKDRQQITQKIEFLIILISGFRDKMKANYQLIKSYYNEIINDLFLNNNEIYSMSCQYKTLYFGPEEFQNNFKKYQTDLETILEKNQQFLKEINFGILVKENNKIVFEGETHKFQQFKKLKKPTSQSERSSIEMSAQNMSQSILAQSTIMRSQGKDSNKDSKENRDKNLQFLASKTPLRPGEQIVKAYSCAFADKILLQGKMYITTERLCFHSKFNSNTVFFGGTFIQIPKEDINKIEKRSNVLIFDNSISITTINGEMFFTSFFSRDQAYKQICRAFEIVADFAFIQEPEQPAPVEEVEQTPEQDDIKDEQIETRRQQIQKVLKEYPYKQIYSQQINSPNINAFKILKIFYLDQEITINRRNYSSFNLYIKQLSQNKDIDIPQYDPNPKKYLNSANIKENTPLQFKKKVTCQTPITGANIPFLPKFATCYQQSFLRIISKDQWYLLTRITSSGAPYAETFQARLYLSCKTVNENTVRFEMHCYVHIFKRTIASSTIESKTPDDTTALIKRIIEQIKKHLKYLQKQKKKQNYQSGQENNGNNALVEQLQTQISELKDKTQNLQKQLKIQKIFRTKAYKIIIGSILLNLLFLVILLN